MLAQLLENFNPPLQLAINGAEVDLAQPGALQPETAPRFKADFLEIGADGFPLLEHQRQGRPQPLLPAQHHQGVGRLVLASLALAGRHPIAQAIHVALLHAFGALALGPGHGFPVDQLHPQPGGGHQPAHLHLFHRQGPLDRRSHRLGLQG